MPPSNSFYFAHRSPACRFRGIQGWHRPSSPLARRGRPSPTGTLGASGPSGFGIIPQQGGAPRNAPPSPTILTNESDIGKLHLIPFPKPSRSWLGGGDLGIYKL